MDQNAVKIDNKGRIELSDMRTESNQNEFKLEPEEIKVKVRDIRKSIITMNVNAGQGHTGADLSETEILACLYFRILRLNRSHLDDPNRDRFILSKGHGVGGLYCTLAEAGYFARSLLSTYLQFESKLPGHPVRQKTPGVELNTGALGHGLSVGVGLALSGKKSDRDYRVFVLTGDGELQEGSVWEAAMSAANFKLDNLIVIVDRNGLQLSDRTENIMGLEPLVEKWTAFGFDVKTTNGNDVNKLVQTIESLDYNIKKPHVILASTKKGFGISFIENRAEWHHKVPSGDEVNRALDELKEKYE